MVLANLPPSAPKREVKGRRDGGRAGVAERGAAALTSLSSAIAILVVHIVLTTLPILAGLIVATALGVRDRLLVLSIGLCGLLVTGYLTFWIYWANASAGRVFAILLMSAVVVVIAWLGLRTRAQLKSIGRELLPPFLLWVASSVLIFSVGAMHPSSQTVTKTAESRFVVNLPIDNEIPLIVANALQEAHRPIAHPLYGVWDSSDRPPLQAGVYLSQEALLPGADAQANHYEVVGILLQGLWIFGIWGLLAAVRARSRLTGLLLTAILFSGFAVVNTFYTWPKLFAAAYLALLTAILFTPSFERLRGSVVAGATAGALAGAALLGHEGSGLALAAFIVVMLIKRRIPTKRFVLAALALIVVTQGSWMAYQKFVDPPGDQLARLQIANQVHLPGDTRPLLTVIASQYESTPFGTIVENKALNLATPLEDVPSYIAGNVRLLLSYLGSGKAASGERRAAVSQLIYANFYYLLPSIGFLALGLIAWAVSFRRRRSPPTPVMRLASLIWIFLAVNVVSWSLLFFGPSATVIHQGTYATELLAFTACVIGLWEFSPRLCATVVLFQASMTVIVYGLNGPAPSVSDHLDTQMVALAILGFAMTVGSLVFLVTRPSIGAEGDSPDVQDLRWVASNRDASRELEASGASVPPDARS